MGKLGLSSLKPGAYLLLAQNQARAFEPEPRLVPLLIPEVNHHYSYKGGFNSQGWLLQKVFLEAKLTWLHIVDTLNFPI